MALAFASGGAFLPGDNYQLTGALVAGGQRRPVVVLSVNGALPVSSSILRIVNGTAGAYTLRAPTADEEGIEVTIAAGSAAAHVVTATGLIQDGVTGGAKTTLTFAAFVGSSITLLAVTTTGAATGTWYVKALNAVVVT
jgi:hypothetical protein